MRNPLDDSGFLLDQIDGVDDQPEPTANDYDRDIDRLIDRWEAGELKAPGPITQETRTTSDPDAQYTKRLAAIRDRAQTKRREALGWSPVPPGYNTPTTVATRMGVHRNSIISAIRSGSLPAIRSEDGKAWLISDEEFANYVRLRKSNRRAP
jgi:excisionase family DNA binding protein